MNRLREKSIDYHQKPYPGKIEVVPLKECRTQDDLSLAYTPGVAEVCTLISEDAASVTKYTAKSNLVGVISNGTAVLGLGNIGPLASKPVMEGKGVLFKRFADIDVFDIEIDESDPERLVEIIKPLEPTFGGINLEDIKGPECFYVEEKLKKSMGIPVFHDDQHGTAIISGAALINALIIAEKKIEDIKMVVNGSGAAGIACSRFYLSLGVRRENLVLCDSKGVIYKGRVEGMNPFKEEFASVTDKRTLDEVVKGCDVFVGLSKADVLSIEMVRTMADNPVIFALANPDPEITYDKALEARSDVIMATGRSDYPNQVNNVLGFPFIFRGALDVNATDITEEMKVAAALSLAGIAREEVDADVLKAYNLESLEFSREYLIPKPFDKRVFIRVSSAVAGAAVESGVARVKNFNKEEYEILLQKRYDERLRRFL